MPTPKNPTEPYALNQVNFAGATLTAAVGAAALTMDCRALGGDTYPKRVLVHARDNDMYIAQGDSAVALHATPANNLIIRAEERVEFTILSADSAYFAHIRVSANGVLAVTRVDIPV